MAILGCTIEAIKEGSGRPKGYLTAFEQIGRWIEADGDPASAVEVVADARRQGMTFGAIADHFRRLRLGNPGPDYQDLLMTIAKAVDGYRKAHPDMPEEWTARALSDLAAMEEDIAD